MEANKSPLWCGLDESGLVQAPLWNEWTAGDSWRPNKSPWLEQNDRDHAGAYGFLPSCGERPACVRAIRHEKKLFYCRQQKSQLSKALRTGFGWEKSKELTEGIGPTTSAH